MTGIGKQRTEGNRSSQLPLVLSGVAVAAAIVAVVLSLSVEKIGVVRTADLVSKYKGMEDARQAFEEQQQGWQSEIDTLESDFRKSVTELNEEWGKLSKSEQEKRRELVGAQEQNLVRYSQTLEARIQEEEGRLIEGVLSQVNDAVREYAESEGYDVIYGATIEGSILHSEESLDITDELIEVLNRAYHAKATDGTDSQ